MPEDFKAGRPADQTQPVSSLVSTIESFATDVRDDVEGAINDLMTYLASPRGKALRSKLAMGVIAIAPVIARAPVVRSNPLFKLLGVAGFAAFLVKLAETVRDWEPEARPG